MTVKSLWVTAFGLSLLVACADGGGKPVPQPTTEQPQPNAERPVPNEQSPGVNPERPPSNAQDPISDSAPGSSGVASSSGGSGNPEPGADQCSTADQCAGCETVCETCHCALGESDICTAQCN